MALLTLVCRGDRFTTSIPRKILVNGQLMGVMNSRSVTFQMIPGEYDITVQSVFPLFFGTQHVKLPLRGEVRVEFSNRERVWDMLFLLDIVLWIVKRFLHLASPWTWLYEVFTNGYFLLWIIYEWRIRDHYYKFEFLS